MTADEWYAELLAEAERLGILHYVTATSKESWVDSYYYDDELPVEALKSDMANSGLEL
jgi:hypothetical protein